MRAAVVDRGQADNRRFDLRSSYDVPPLAERQAMAQAIRESG